MNIEDFRKATSLKKTCEIAEKTRDLVSQEHKKIIKLRVAQDTAYWDVREKLRQVESNHEKLQKNMVDMQMQYETLSGQYEDELRFRPETLNKLSSTREICDVLEDYNERLRGILSRCKADQVSLYEAYQRSCQVVQELKTQQQRAEEKSQEKMDNLQEKVKMSSEHNSQLLQCLEAERKRAAAELKELKEQLATVQTHKEELLAAARELDGQLRQARFELEKKEEKVVGMQREMKNIIHQFNLQDSEMKSTIMKQEKELKETSDAKESLKQALANQDTFTQSICEQNSQLQEKLAALEGEQGLTCKLVEELRIELQKINLANDNLKKEVETLIGTNEKSSKEINDKKQLLATAKEEIKKLKVLLSTSKSKEANVVADLNKADSEIKAMAEKVQELTAAGKEMENKISEIEAAFNTCSETAEKKIKELSTIIENKNKEMERQSVTLSEMMHDIKNGTEERGKLQAGIEKVKKEMDAERQAASEREKKAAKQIEQFEIIVRNKDVEYAKQINVIMELRSDKERLQEKIQAMQNKIDNIHKELAAPTAARAPRFLPELDDNAIMLSPHADATKEKTAPPVQTQAPHFLLPRRDSPRVELKQFHFMSDTSMDGEKTVDAGEVNLRFEAMIRGDRVPPLLPKRRRVAPSAPSQPHAQSGPRPKEVLPQRQVKDASKERMFFKTKRNEMMKKAK